MDAMLSNLQLTIPENIFIKDPQSTKLGRRILNNAIKLIHEHGLEWFTFKKLAKYIQSNESSIYRYFENKHKLLLYLISWYWGWLEYKLVFRTQNISQKRDLLQQAVIAITEAPQKDETFGFINEEKLHYIIVQEYSKAFYTPHVDEENKSGDFLIYKRLNERLSAIIVEASPSYGFPKSMASMILQGALTQNYFHDHFPQLVDSNKNNHTSTFFLDVIFKSLINE